MTYTPSQKTLERYADVLVNFALNNGSGVRKGETVRITAGEFAKPLFLEVRKAVWKAGGHVMDNYYPDSYRDGFNPDKDFYDHSKDEQLNFYPNKYFEGLAATMDHSIYILADVDKESLSGVDPKMMMQRGEVMRPFKELLVEKENKGKFSWTLAMYGTPAGAQEAGMSYEQYWKQIIKACYLDKTNPVAEWKRLDRKIASFITKMNKLPVEKYHIEGPDVDLWITRGEKRRWLGGRGANIPSFEVFCSPDWRGTEGWIRFNQPLYRYGNLITGIELEFKKGKVVRAQAQKNEKILKEMIATKNADKIGEFSLTDKRTSRITKFMAETLYDENMGGPHGNTHIALGDSYHDSFTGNAAQMKKSDWRRLGFNNSSVHTDIISTTKRTVTAHMKDGSTKVIYKNGMFTL